MLLCAATTLSAQTLEDAYQTELERLTAEKKALGSALRKAKSRAKRTRGKLVSEIESLASKLTRLRTDNAKQENDLPDAVRSQSTQDQERSIERRKQQIETWIEIHGVTLPAAAVDKTTADGRHRHPPIDVMVGSALKHIAQRSQLWLEPRREYFGTDGAATVGPVLHIAEVGAIAVEAEFRPLDLALDGSLRLTQQLASAPVVHGDARSVGVILFDRDDIRPSQAADAGWQSWFDRGGVVMWAIAALAVLALLIFLERMLAFLVFFVRVLAAERRGPAVSISSGNTLLAPVAVIQSGQGNIEEIEADGAHAVLQLQAYIRRGISLLAVVASVAPLLGLLGTVTGMIGTFAMITEHGTGDPRLLSGGISEALLTTQFGLMVAIPALLFQTTLYRCGDGILRRIEAFALAALQIRIDIADAQVEQNHVMPARSVK